MRQITVALAALAACFVTSPMSGVWGKVWELTANAANMVFELKTAFGGGIIHLRVLPAVHTLHRGEIVANAKLTALLNIEVYTYDEG